MTRDEFSDRYVIVLVLMIGLLVLGLGAGCSGTLGETRTYYDSTGKITRKDIREEDNRCAVQSSVTVLGIDVQVFDFMGSSSSSPSKVRLGYVSSQQQVTPMGMTSKLLKEYNVDSGTYEIKMLVDTERK